MMEPTDSLLLFQFIESYEKPIIQSIILILLLAFIKMVIRKITNKVINKFHFRKERKSIISKSVDIFIVIFAIIALTAIWSVDTQEILLFLTSVLTVIGIAFFAQWSILSNITASMILFFSHPLKIGGYIKIVDKDIPLEGFVENISLFYLYIRTKDDQIVTIPNTIVLQKTIAMGESKMPDKEFTD